MSMTRTAEDRKRQVVTEFRRSEILSAAMRVFGAKGFEATRMDDIAEAAELAKGTLYIYFPSKDAIYEATVQQALAEIAALTQQRVAAAPDFAGQLEAFIGVRLNYWQEQQALYRVISSLNREMRNRKRSLKWQQQTVDYLVSLFTAAERKGELPRQDIQAAAWALLDLIRGINERRILRHERPPEEEVRFLTAFMLSALQYRRKE